VECLHRLGEPEPGEPPARPGRGAIRIRSGCEPLNLPQNGRRLAGWHEFPFALATIVVQAAGGIIRKFVPPEDNRIRARFVDSAGLFLLREARSRSARWSRADG
jgi:hypothetical protein